MNNFLVVTNKQKDSAFSCTNRIKGYLERHGKSCLTETGDVSELKIPEGVQCVIVLGGDGTLLRAARNAADANVPLIGVNLGTMGYLAEVDSAYLEEALDQLMADDFTREKRMMLSGRVVSAEGAKEISIKAEGEGAGRKPDKEEAERHSSRKLETQEHSGCESETEGQKAGESDIGAPETEGQKAGEPGMGVPKRREDCALNDIAITRRGSLQIITFHIYVNGQLLHTCHADGILVATPTGSTGYNLSAGGPIVEPHAQLILLTPICPHTMSSRPIVLSAEDEVVIEIGENKKGIIQEVEACFDGSAKMAMYAGDRMEIKRAGKVTEMLKLSQDSFVEVLHKKMDA